MFTTDEDGVWMTKDQKERERVTIIHQDYFLKDKTNKYNSRGIDWEHYQRAILSIIAGNDFTIKNAKLKGKDVVLKPGKLLILEGNHVFM